MTKSPFAALRSYIRHHGECAASGFETMTPEDAAEHALWRLELMLAYLDRLDDADRTARICGLIGVEVGIDGEPLVRHGDL